MHTLLQDLRYGARMLVTKPGFTLVAIITLALGIGASTAIFSVVNGVLLRPLPYDDPDRLVVIWGTHPQIGREEASLPDFLDWRDQNRSFESIAATSQRSFNLTGTDEPERVIGAAVTADFFSVLRAQPILGRGFLPEEDRRGGPRAVVLSHSFWQRRFGSDPTVVGQSLMLDGRDHSVVGVAPPHLRLPSESEFWVPLAMDPTQAGRRSDFLLVYGRLAPGTSLEQARADLNMIMARLEEQYPGTNAGWRADPVPLYEQIVGDVRTTLWVLLAAVAFVLLIACANVANLLLARASTREREIAIRRALGAGRGRLVRQLLTESVLLALVGGLSGVLLAFWAGDLLLKFSPQDIPRLNEVRIDSRVLGFAALVSLVTGILFGLAPALQASTPNLNESLKDGRQSVTASVGRRRMRSLLVIAEVALSLVLLVGAGLTIKSLFQLMRLDAGFNRENLLTLQLTLPRAKYAEGHQWAAFYDQLLERVRALPGVVSATAASPLPLSGGGNFFSFAVAGRPAPPPEVVQDANVLFVGDRYIETLGIPLLSGRTLTEQDRQGRPRSVLINRSLARRYFGDENPEGQRLTFGDPQAADTQWMTVVGVVADVKHKAVEDQIYPAIYVPQSRPGMSLIVRAAGDPLSLAGVVRSEVKALDKDLPVFNLRSMDQVLSSVLAQRRFSMLLLSIFAGAALLLAVVGIYGVMAYLVAQRTQEIGIRIALGAQVGDILRMVLGQGMSLAITGIGVGIGAALGLMRFLASLLHGVTTTDVTTFIAVALMQAGVALLACYLPARRAAKVHPMEALRYE